MPIIRFDQLMSFCWTVLLPLIFALMFLILSILISFDAIPTNISCLFVPGLIAYNSNRGANKGKPLYRDIRANQPVVRSSQLTFWFTFILHLIFIYTFISLSTLISFYASPTNIAYLFSLGFTHLNSKDSSPTKGKSLFLPISVEKTYVNFHEQATIDLIIKDLNRQSGIYAFKHNTSNKMYIGSSIN